MSHTILVVEDEVDLLFTVTLTLELAGYRVVPAKSGEEALAAVDEHEPDVVVLDLRLPGIDGWEVTRRLGERGDRRPIPVVILSAQVDTATASRAKELGCAGYLAKPFRTDELLQTLQRLHCPPDG